MARYSNYESWEQRQERLKAESEDRLSEMQSSGYTPSGNRIIGWSDSKTPLTVGKDGLTGGNGLTPKSIWDATFRNRSAANNSRVESLPSLSTLAAGGLNSAQRWMQPVAPASPLTQFSTTPADARAIANRYSPNPSGATTVFDNTPGTRQPFLAGANGVNVGPTIAARVSQNDPTLDRNYVNKSAGVPNLLSPVPANQPDWKKQFSWSSAFDR